MDKKSRFVLAYLHFGRQKLHNGGGQFTLGVGGKSGRSVTFSWGGPVRNPGASWGNPAGNQGQSGTSGGNNAAGPVGSFGFGFGGRSQSRRTGDERFPEPFQSYWVPYGDRTVAAMSFPVITHDLFTPVVIKEVILPLGKAKSLYKKHKVMQPKSDFGVVVSRNSVLKRNFRDYMRLNLYEGDSRAPDELVLDVAKNFAQSRSFRKNRKTFVIVAFESHLKTPFRGELSGTVGGSPVLHNGTIIFPSKVKDGHLTTIPFTVKNLQEVEDIIGEYTASDWRNSWSDLNHETMQTKSFIKLLAGIHKDTFEDGRDAMERFHRRSSSLQRPYFSVPVELVLGPNTNETREEREDRLQREQILQTESRFRNEAWFSTSTIGIRSISPPQFVENLVPVVPDYPDIPYLPLPQPVDHIKVVENKPPVHYHQHQSHWNNSVKLPNNVYGYHAN